MSVYYNTGISVMEFIIQQTFYPINICANFVVYLFLLRRATMEHVYKMQDSFILLSWLSMVIKLQLHVTNFSACLWRSQTRNPAIMSHWMVYLARSGRHLATMFLFRTQQHKYKECVHWHIQGGFICQNHLLPYIFFLSGNVVTKVLLILNVSSRLLNISIGTFSYEGTSGNNNGGQYLFKIMKI